jgi:stage V sporulation protein D (sporulation-specific penicillin-binding protein)
MRTRIKIIALFILLLFTSVIVRLFYWQIIKGSELSARARSQYSDGYVVAANRGDILSNDGSWLAASTTSWLLHASIRHIDEHPYDIAEKLAPVLVSEKDEEAFQTEKERLLGLLTRQGAVWVPLKQNLSTKQKEQVENLKIRGLGFDQQETRIYPESSSAAHLLGFVGKNEDGEDIGYFGLEGFYNLTLTGRRGVRTRDADARGIPLFLGSTREVPAISGVDLITHIDKRIQLTLENKLKKGIERYGAISGTVIVMEPKGGAILAMGSFPSYDPANYRHFSDLLFSNPAVSSSFEPGSVFKVIVMAAALDAGVLTPATVCDICNGPYKVDRFSIGTWDGNYHPNSTMTEVIKNSDNVGMVFVSRKLGHERMYDYLDKFGFGKNTGIDLQGEFSPSLRSKNTWNIVDLATASFGQGVAVTPIQLTKSVAIIANGGMDVAPQVVARIKGEGWSEEVKPQKGSRVISGKAASQITAMMAEAARSGEAKWTHLKGYKIAGKTGTAQIPIAGHYDKEKTIASFIGFAPYDNPKFVMLVTLREPKTSPWASETAAPLWYEIAEDIFKVFGIRPDE